MTVNFSQYIILLTAFVVLAALGGRCLAETVINSTRRWRLLAAAGVLACIAAFAVIVTRSG